ncbi:hypothetical protein GGR55DRAFT_78684 [Xylaria sp. FL0064]|nr:hypothetical protein GGR55DRAFT_78684 [Xylaria sp. FL0064]
MMPNHFPHQYPSQILLGPLHGLGQNHYCQHLPSNTVTPSKRPIDEDDDDIQFISEKPVRKRRTSEKRPAVPVTERSQIPCVAALSTAATDPTIAPSAPAMASQMPDVNSRDTERRLSTGMVGLPHDRQAVELTYALRGVSMPVLENFVLDQPFRKSRLPSPPELSPKQLPSSAPPAIPNVSSNHSAPKAFGIGILSDSRIPCASSSHIPRDGGTPITTSDLTENSGGTQQSHALKAATHPGNGANSTSPNHDMKTGPNSIPNPTPGHLTHSQAAHHAGCSGSNPKSLGGHSHLINSAHSQKQSCQICSQLRHQARLSRQGVPTVNTNLRPHLMPQLHYQMPYGQQLHPQMIPIPMSGNMHQYGANFAPVMVPASNNTFVPLSSHPQPQIPPRQATPQQQMEAEKCKQSASKSSSKTNPPQASQLKNIVPGPSTASSPLKPPPSLIQPTYRKPSPNLIVEVAETCQEKFPFEEVAKRHNVPVDKVFDVFAAIIQVPLLRCPTDRRRAGRLATARIKEYNKAKKDIENSGAGRAEGQTPVAMVNPTNIAQRLGPVEPPEGFLMGSTAGSSGHA